MQNAERWGGVYKPKDYDKVVLPFVLPRRLDCVLEPTKAKAEVVKPKGVKLTDPLADKVLQRAARVPFCNTSALDFRKLKDDRHRKETGSAEEYGPVRQGGR